MLMGAGFGASLEWMARGPADPASQRPALRRRRWCGHRRPDPPPWESRSLSSRRHRL